MIIEPRELDIEQRAVVEDILTYVVREEDLIEELIGEYVFLKTKQERAYNELVKIEKFLEQITIEELSLSARNSLMSDIKLLQWFVYGDE